MNELEPPAKRAFPLLSEIASIDQRVLFNLSVEDQLLVTGS